MTNIASLVRRYWNLMNDNDWAGAAELFSEGFVFSWPQSGERIRSKAIFVAVNAHYPAKGRWTFTLDRIVAMDPHAVTEVRVTDGAVEAVAITFFDSDGVGITKIIEYWPDPFPAAAWRRQWVDVSA